MAKIVSVLTAGSGLEWTEVQNLKPGWACIVPLGCQPIDSECLCATDCLLGSFASLKPAFSLAQNRAPIKQFSSVLLLSDC